MVSTNSKIVIHRSAVIFLAVLLYIWLIPASAAVQLNPDWPPENLYQGPDDGPRPYDEANDNLPATTKTEVEKKKLDAAVSNATDELEVTGSETPASQSFGFKLQLDKVNYYVAGATLMPKRKPNEICTPIQLKNDTSYKCKEGRAEADRGVLFFFNSKFINVGSYELKITQPYEYSVYDLSALGVADKDLNTLLVTTEYFPIDKRTVSSRGTQNHMTMLLRLKAVDGKIQVEQDDTCLKNPNKISKIATARKLLKQCEASKQKPVNSKTSQKKTP